LNHIAWRAVKAYDFARVPAPGPLAAV